VYTNLALEFLGVIERSACAGAYDHAPTSVV
jgi:hypothetical protein